MVGFRKGPSWTRGDDRERTQKDPEGVLKDPGGNHNFKALKHTAGGKHANVGNVANGDEIGIVHP